MESFFVRFKNPLILLFVLLIQTIGLAVQVRRPAAPGAMDTAAADPRSISLIRYWVVSVVSPFESLFHGIGHNVYSGWANYVDLRHTRQQNADLKKQLDDMRIQQAAIAQDALQGHRLQAILDFQQHYVTTTVAAQVIGTSGIDLSRVVYIDKGREEGLKPDQAVITPDGIVGKIRDVFPHTAQVLLIDDQSSGAGVLLSTSRIRAILRGASPGRVVINNLTADSRIKPGETVLTSGGDQVFPRGLPVGTVESIAPDLDHQPYTIIQVRPAANLSQLEEVLVITGTQSKLPLQAQQDLAQGAATAAEQQAVKEAAAEAAARTAAEAVADRLPSINDTTAQTSTDPNAKSTDPNADPNTPRVPRPTPALRPDRYTPGSTPPASTLTPGTSNSNPTSPANSPTSTGGPPGQSTSPAKSNATQSTPEP
jgi:rod shape-determining protein MreC